MKKKKPFLLSVALMSLGCNMKTDNIYKFGSLSFYIPNSAKVIEVREIDSHVKKIALNQRDTLTVEFGRHVFNLKEDFITVMSSQDKQELESLAGKTLVNSNIIVSESAEEDTQYGLFLKNYYIYDTISGIAVEVVRPKKIGQGITGVYISKLKDGNSYSIYGINLDTISHEETMRLIRSIHYSTN